MDNVPATVESRSVSPAGEVAFATEAAKVLMDIVKKGKLSKRLGGDREHIMFEGWSTVARFYGYTIKTKEVKPVGPADDSGKYPGYVATAVLLDASGREVGQADSSCQRDESTWRNRQNYALMSMAQTRAGAKAARMVLSWVVVLAGYSPTPLEEMPENGHTEPEKGHPEHEPPKSPPAKGGFKEFLRLMAELKAAVGDEVYYPILGAAGVEHANEIKNREQQKKVYKELQAALAAQVVDESFPGATTDPQQGG